MRATATLQFETTYNEVLYDLLQSEDYNFKPKELNIEIIKQPHCVEVQIRANTPQLLKIATTAVSDSCEVIRKTQELVEEQKNKNE
ncbi:MAG: hypothetical protein ACLFPL_03540 [Candidatus Nanoarchaeia archaeon]